MKTLSITLAATALLFAGAANAQDKPAPTTGAMSSSMPAKPAGAMSSSMSSSAKPMSKKDMKAMDACHKMDADAMAKDKKCQMLMAKSKPADSTMPMKK